MALGPGTSIVCELGARGLRGGRAFALGRELGMSAADCFLDLCSLVSTGLAFDFRDAPC